MTISDSQRALERLEACFFQALGRIDLVEKTREAFAGAVMPRSVLAVGKSAGPMMDGAVRALPDGFAGALLCVVPDGAPLPASPAVEVLRAAHPYPDARVLDVEARIGTLEGPLWLCLSGGGSACLSAPVPGISVEKLAEMTRALMLRGASIRELNTVRKALCPMLGGGIGARFSVVNAAVSVDIADEDVALVASGPALPDQSDDGEWRDILERAGIAIPEHLVVTTKNCPAHPHAVIAAPSILRRELALVVGGHEHAVAMTRMSDVDALVEKALALGGVHVAVGEVTTRIPEHAPPGGRCSHLALHVLGKLRDSGRAFSVLAVGSDGRDGPTEFAGARFTEQLARRITRDDGERALLRGESAVLLGREGALIPRFPSLHNLLDVVMLEVGDEDVAHGTGHR